MKIKQNTIAFIIVTLISLVMLITTYSLKNVDAWLLPRIVCYILLVLSIAGTIKSVFDNRKISGAEGESTRIFKPEEIRPLSEMSAWLLGFVLAIYLFGVYPSILVFAFAYMIWRGRKWHKAAIFSIVLTSLLYVMLRYGLSAMLHEGLLFMRMR